MANANATPATPATPAEPVKATEAKQTLRMPVPVFRNFVAFPPTERRSFAGRTGKSTVLCRITAELTLGDAVLATVNTAVWLRENPSKPSGTEVNIAVPPAVNTRGEGIGLGADLSAMFIAKADEYLKAWPLYSHNEGQATKALFRKDVEQTQKVAATVAAKSDS